MNYVILITNNHLQPLQKYGTRIIFYLLNKNKNIITVAINVIIAVITQAVPISISLGRILHCFAVVTSIAVDILIAVLLVNITNKPTIVLGQTKEVGEN